jgi:hypothetical protein
MRAKNLPTMVVGALVVVVVFALLGVPPERLLPWALVLACPLMMLVMMRGMHGGEQGHSRQDDPQASRTTSEQAPSDQRSRR